MKKNILTIISLFTLVILTSCNTLKPNTIEEYTLIDYYDNIEEVIPEILESTVKINYNDEFYASGYIYKKNEETYYCVSYLFFDYEYYNSDLFTISLNDQNISISVIGYDLINMIALFSFKTNVVFNTIELINDYIYQKGQTVITTSISEANNDYYFSSGVVSLNRNNYFMNDSFRGKSSFGSLLFDIDGNFIGITYDAINSIQSNSNDEEIFGLSYCHKISTIKKIILDIEKTGFVQERKKIGINGGIYYKNIDDITYVEGFNSHVFVTNVNISSIFYIKIKENDIILKINDKNVYNLEDVRQILNLTLTTEVITIDILRVVNGTLKNITITG